LTTAEKGLAAAMAAMFYEELLKGERRVAALYAAKREMRRLNPLDPIAWGGLILDGNPARLARFEPLSQLSVATLVWPKVLGPALTSAETIPPAEQAEALYQQGLGQMHDQADDQAEQAFTAAMNLEGARAETAALALYERAGLYRRRGQLPLAFQDYARLLSIRNVPPRLRLGALADRGTTHIMNHDDAAAIADYTAYVQLPDVSESDRLQVLQNRGFAYLRNGNFEAAAADFTTIITTPGADRVQRAKALGNRGECYRHRGQCDLALQDVDLGLRMGVGDAQLIRLLHTVRALTYFDSGALPQAVAELTFLLAEPDVPAGAAEIDLWYRAGAYQALGQVDQARLDYQALIDLPNASANYVDDARQRLVALNTDP